MITTQCLFYHPQNEEEHTAMFERLEYGRSVGDTNLVMVYLCCLTACACGWEPTPKEEQ